MWVGLDRLGHLLVDASVAMVVFLSLAVVLMLACHQPARRIVLAQAAILVAILMIPLVAASPLPRLNPVAWVLPDSTGREGRDARHVPPGAPEPRWGRAGPWTLRIATLGYLAGVTTGIGWIAIGFWGIRRLVHDSAGPRPETWETYLEIAHAAGDRVSIPRLRVSPRVSRPVLTGLFRSIILIPPALDEPGFDRDSLRLTLIHELAHADRADTVLGAAASLAQALWFFLPHVWWLRSQLRMDQEFLADQETVEQVGSSAAYATRLVALAAPTEVTPSLKPLSASVPLLSGWWWDGGLKTPLLQRVVMLLHAPFPVETRPPRLWSILAPLGLVGLGILASSLSLFARTGTTDPPGSDGAARGTPRVFRVSRFEASPRVTAAGGRSLPYTLPLALPARFELSVEIEAPTPSLSRMWLAGYPLGGSTFGTGHLPPQPGAAGEPARWHPILLRRDGSTVSLSVDGQAVPVLRTDAETLDWLTVEPPPDQTVSLRNLIVTW